MTAVMERPIETSPEGAELAELRSMLVEQSRMLAAQRRMLELLDARREQVDELVADTLPVINAAMLMVMRFADRAGALHLEESMAASVGELNSIRRAPAPGLFALLKRLRDPDVRRAAALVIAGLGAVGRATGEPHPTRMNGRTT